MNRPTVLILSTDPLFSRELTAKWPQGSGSSLSPGFVALDPSVAGDLGAAHYDLAISDACQLTAAELKLTKKMLAAAGNPAIIVHCDAALGCCAVKGTVTILHRDPFLWAELTGLLGAEMLCRRQAEARCQEAIAFSQAAQADATLGRYMLEMRINVNNALTTLLGNAELLSHESGLSASVQSEADAIRNMALRLHVIFQRFSLLDRELEATVRSSASKAIIAATTS